jgi:hypothetical protein
MTTAARGAIRLSHRQCDAMPSSPTNQATAQVVDNSVDECKVPVAFVGEGCGRTRGASPFVPRRRGHRALEPSRRTQHKCGGDQRLRWLSTISTGATTMMEDLHHRTLGKRDGCAGLGKNPEPTAALYQLSAGRGRIPASNDPRMPMRYRPRQWHPGPPCNRRRDAVARQAAGAAPQSRAAEGKKA